ncbi:hypothetical protein CLG96_13470 [Sphingomonas oleivorans]|uniref:Phosphoesterase HXTX n=2 Tax=Sphingomonas oleivorans TaxID=1735121 RepID=A0A2T5FWI5_9SPHN|nr:hypothetical protein CLG96_13470 [Sphingomonas oleivorans]
MPAPIIVTALFAPADFAWLDGLRRTHYPPERNRVPAHLTLFHHLPPSIGPELRARLNEATRGLRLPVATISGLIRLDGGVALRVSSEGLTDIRACLADAFASLLLPQDRAGWRPHVTIQNRASAAQATLLHRRLAAGFRPRAIGIAGLACWHYRDGPWEALSRHMFG